MEIQFRALRDALDKAGRSAQTAEDATRRAREELHTERTKSSCFQFKIEDLTKKLAIARRDLKAAKDEATKGRVEATNARAEATKARAEATKARAEATTALEELKVEKAEGRPSREEVKRLTEENKRLRTNVGELCQERDELKRLCKETGVAEQKDAPPATMVIGFEMLRPTSALDALAQADAKSITIG